MSFQQRELSEEEERVNTKAVLAHVLPFVMWLTMMVWLDDPAWNYNARTLGGLLLFKKPLIYLHFDRIDIKQNPSASSPSSSQQSAPLLAPHMDHGAPSLPTQQIRLSMM